MKPFQTTLFFMLISELKYPLNLKVKLLASWLCSAGTTSWHTAAFNVFLRLTGDLHRVHSSSMESSFPLLSPMFTSCYKPLPSFVNWLTASLQWKFPTLCTVIVFANINHTNRQHFEIPNDKQQMTCPSGQSTRAEFLSNTDAYRLLLKALLGLSDHVMLLLSGRVSSVQTELCSLQLGTLLMNLLTRGHHTVHCVWRYVHHINHWQWTDLFWDQGWEEAACWRPHQALKRFETSPPQSPLCHNFILRFRLLLELFVLVHDETLWAFKSWRNYIHVEARKTSLPLSLSVSVSLFDSCS